MKQPAYKRVLALLIIQAILVNYQCFSAFSGHGGDEAMLIDFGLAFLALIAGFVAFSSQHRVAYLFAALLFSADALYWAYDFYSVIEYLDNSKPGLNFSEQVDMALNAAQMILGALLAFLFFKTLSQSPIQPN